MQRNLSIRLSEYLLVKKQSFLSKMVNTAYIPVSCPETPHSSLPIAQTYQIFKGNHKSHLFQSYQLLYEAIISYLILNLMLLTIQTFPQFNIPFVFRHLMINFFIITMKFPNATHKPHVINQYQHVWNIIR